jgi:hypothetical protein
MNGILLKGSRGNVILIVNKLPHGRLATAGESFRKIILEM